MPPARQRTLFQLLALLCLSLILSSCALATRGGSQLVPVDSVPAGAEVFVDGELVGETPLELELARSSEHQVTVMWNGQERSFTLRPELDGEGTGLLVADAVPGGVLIGLGVYTLLTCDRGGFFDFCDLVGWGSAGAGTVVAAIPIAVDAGTGGIYRLSPSEVFVSFD